MTRQARLSKRGQAGTGTEGAKPGRKQAANRPGRGVRAPVRAAAEVAAAEVAPAARSRARAAAHGRGAPRLVVGIGASAGGLEALSAVISRLAPDTGVAVVVAQHLAPQHRSMMVELIARQTKLPVLEIKTRLRLKPNTIYITPPNKDVAVEGRALVLRAVSDKPGPKPSIDGFLASLAQDCGPAAVGIILSGSGSDGARGIRAIKQAGGLTIAQDPASAKYASMPSAAIETGAVDRVLPPDQIATLLAVLADPSAARTSKQQNPEAVDPFQRILALLRRVTKIDFAGYKRSMIDRRVSRRMNQLKVKSLAAFADYLALHDDEVLKLAHEFLISVTSFLRDAPSFEALKGALLDDLARKEEDEPFRIWVAGCASGEEAYSLAMLLHDMLAEAERANPVQIFATDVDAEAIERARKGVYPAAAVGSLSPALIRRHLKPAGANYVVGQHLRDMVIFSIHDVIHDPPFIKLDVVSCRNLLIYLAPEWQRWLIDTFHHALISGGLLYLGRSETVTGSENLFQAYNKRHRIYRKIGVSRPPLQRRVLAGRTLANQVPPAAPKPTAFNLEDLTFRRLAERFGPPSLVIDDSMEVRYVFGNVQSLLRIQQGAWQSNVLHLLREEFRVDVQAMIFKARRSGKEVSSLAPYKGKGETMAALRIVAQPFPISGTDSSLTLVSFEQQPSLRLTASTKGDTLRDASQVQALQHELMRNREHLQTVIEELETANEELQSTNEELQASNEELQSTNEEMETANEELQSTNEELVTVNEELQIKTTELALSNTHLENIQNSVGVGLLVVDPRLKVRSINAAAVSLLGSRATALGEEFRLAQVDRSLRKLDPWLFDVVEKHRAAETPLSLRGRSFVLSVSPYRSQGGHPSGAVLTITDNSMVVEAEQRYRRIVETAPNPILLLSPEGRVLEANRAAEEVLGLPAGEIHDRNYLESFVPEELRNEVAAAFRNVLANSDSVSCEHEILAANDERRTITWNVVPLIDLAGHAWGILEIGLDVTGRKHMEEALRASEARFRALASNIPGIVFQFSLTPAGAIRFEYASEGIRDLLGRSKANDQIPDFLTAIYSDDRLALEQIARESAERLLPWSLDLRVDTRDHGRRWLHVVSRPRTLTSGRILWDGVAIDITAQKAAERAVEDSRDLLDAVYRSAGIAMCVTDEESRFLKVNPAFCRLLRYEEAELLGQHFAMVVPAEHREAVEERHRRFIATGEAEASEIMILSRNGMRIWVALTAGRLITKDGRRCRVATLEDVSLKKAAEVALRMARDEALMASRSKSEFLANMSHELRTPLNAIMGFAEMIQLGAYGPPGSPKYTEYAGDIHASAEHLLDIINDILDLAKIEAGRLELHLADCKIPDLLQACVRLVTERAAAAEVGLDVDVAAGLPTLEADERKLKQVMLNLLSNALKFTPKGGHIRIAAGHDEESDGIVLSVSDTGAGIAEEDLPRVIQPFLQGENILTRTHEGTGLGLPLSKALVELHHGTLAIESKLGAGTKVTVRLPRQRLLPRAAD